MITRRGLFLGLTLALASMARTLGLSTQPEAALARRRRRHRNKGRRGGGGGGGGGYY